MTDCRMKYIRLKQSEDDRRQSEQYIPTRRGQRFFSNNIFIALLVYNTASHKTYTTDTHTTRIQIILPFYTLFFNRASIHTRERNYNQ